MDIKRLCRIGTRYFFDSDYRFRVNSIRGAYDAMPDEEYLQKLYKASMGRKLNLENPQSFNEKLQWMKLYNRKPEYTIMVDKFAVRQYIAEKLGEEYLIPLIGAWENPNDIEFNELPDQFVLKCNHNSGLGMCICKDKSHLNMEKVKQNLNLGLAEDYYLANREWPYKDVPRKIVGEKLLSDDSEGDLMDYKLMCFNGEVRCSFVCSERFSDAGLKVTFFDRDWEVMPFERTYPKSRIPIAKPKNYDKMITLAERLSEGIPFVRVDFYECGGKIYFGELTFFPGAGLEAFQPEEWDYKLGSWITLPKKTV